VRRGSRDGNDLNVHPETTRTYVLRAMLFDACGRRMSGNARHNAAYYMCWPKSNNRGRPDKYVRHPKAVYIREDAVLDAVSGFYGDRVFGVDHWAILTTDLATLDDREALAWDAERGRLQRTLADLVRRQDPVMRQAQDGNPDDRFTRALRGTYNDLDAERTAALAAIASQDAADMAAPAHPDAGDVDLLDALPLLNQNLTEVPEPLLRKLFEATSRTVRLTDDGDRLTISIRIRADTVPEITRAAEMISEKIAESNKRLVRV
jgi:site-specific DNA recombinase